MKEKENKLILIPKTENYIKYILQIIFKLPRTEKFSIGTEYKSSMYQMLQDIMMIIDSNLNAQRIYLRIMKENKWIDKHKFQIAIEQIYEIGKIIGGLIKYYAKNN